MRVSFLLHLYQPSVQSKEIFDRVYSDSYLPLIRYIKKKKQFNLTLSIPFSLLEQMDNYGYHEWIKDLNLLIKQNRVEVTGGAAYHPLLTKIEPNYVEKQIIFNEYGLGYFLGRRQGFEGEEAVMIKDLAGFFPPEMSINMEVLEIINDLGYNWVAVDENAIESKSNQVLYKVSDIDTLVVKRNKEISNLISFKRDIEEDDIVKKITQVKNCVICLDGEYFGHHFKEGIVLLDNIIDSLLIKKFEFVKVSDMVSVLDPKEIKEIKESSWGAGPDDIKVGDIYPMWDHDSNGIHVLLWQIMSEINSRYKTIKVAKNIEGGNSPIWKDEGLEQIDDSETRMLIEQDVLLLKTMSSDQFWWGSRVMLPNAVYLYSKEMIDKYLSLYEKLLLKINDPKLTEFVEEKVEKIRAIEDSLSNQEEVEKIWN